jgi:hypothetical protein
MTSPGLTKNPSERAIGERYYPLLLASFQQKHKGVQITIQEDVGVGIVLHSADQGDPTGNKLDFAVIRKTLRFDWSLTRGLFVEAQELAEEGRRRLNADSCGDLLGVLYNIFSQIQATIGRENRLCRPDQDERTPPSPRIEQDVEIIHRQLDAARRQFQDDVEREAQFKYAVGMALGAALMLAVCGALAGILASEHIRVVNAVGLAAGAIGACVSVLRRMAKGNLEINAQSGNGMIIAFGAVRPVIGGIFGFVLYLVIRAELISFFTLPTNKGTALAYVSVFAFVAGFNERFFQDVLANASNSRNEEF